MVREKEIYEKLRAEIHSTDISNYEDLKKLKYTDMVGTKNAMRELFWIIWMTNFLLNFRFFKYAFMSHLWHSSSIIEEKTLKFTLFSGDIGNYAVVPYFTEGG